MPVRLFRFDAPASQPIGLFGSTGARACGIAHGRDESHVYVVHLDAGGVIGPHPAGFDQVFLAVQGAGWVAGSDGVRHALPQGQGAFVPRGEMHAKGSDTGMVAVMVQAASFDPPPG